MSDESVVDISRRGTFSIKEVNTILPVVTKITEEYSRLVNDLVNRLEALSSSEEQDLKEVEEQVNHFIQQWHLKIHKLGGRPKGLWLVDFDSGDGYYCWKYPEPEVSHWHSYSDGFLGRVALSERKPNNESSTCTDQLNPW